MIDSGFMGVVFNNFFAFSGFMGIVFCKNSFIGEPFWHFRIYGHDFQKIFQIYGYTLRNCSTLAGGTLRFEWHNPVSWKLKLPPGI